jgi:sulfatase maturation enzyme AslB (radical SAM superfamily)
MNKRILNFEITLTLQCNMACKYCFEKQLMEKIGGHDIKDKIDIYIKLIKEIKKTDWYKEKYMGINITWFGGEPSLKAQAIERFVNAFKDDNTMTFFLISNGYYFNDRLKKLVSKYKNEFINGRPKFLVQISYDGKMTHDKWRIDRKKQPTSEKVLKTVDWLHNNNIPFTLNSVIAPEDFQYLYENYLEFKDIIREKNMRYNYAPKIELNGNFIVKEKHQEYLENLRNSLKKIIIDIKKTGVNNFGWLNGVNRRFCSVGVDLFGLHDGMIIPCHGFIYVNDFYTNKKHIIYDMNKKFDINNIIKALDKRRQQTSKVFGKEPEKCKTCIATTCFRCNSITYDWSKKKEYFKKWIDYGYNVSVCEYYQEIGKFYYALQKLK